MNLERQRNNNSVKDLPTSDDCDIHTILWIGDMDTDMGCYGRTDIGIRNEGAQETSANPVHVTGD